MIRTLVTDDDPFIRESLKLILGTMTDIVPVGACADGQEAADFDLTETEASVVGKIAEGLSNKEIAQELHLSEGTVKNYITTILGKLSLRDRTQIAIFYLKEIDAGAGG